MAKSSIRFYSYPQTVPPPKFISPLIDIFKRHEKGIASVLGNTLDSDGVLAVLEPDLLKQDWTVEAGKDRDSTIKRPVFFGENGVPTRTYNVDAYQSSTNCGLEIEAGRAWMGNAIYRDLVLAMMMVNVDHLVIAVRNEYRYKSGSKTVTSQDFSNAHSVFEALFAQARIRMPYGLTLVGY